MANKISDAVIASAIDARISPITVIILDSSANIIVQKRMDGCPPVGPPSFAYGKAATCISMRTSSRAFRDKYTIFPDGEIPDPQKYCQLLSMTTVMDGKMAPFPGGVLLKARETGEIVGSIGVSGATSDEDERAALVGAAIFADILVTDPK